jgi:hypothetical protein
MSMVIASCASRLSGLSTPLGSAMNRTDRLPSIARRKTIFAINKQHQACPGGSLVLLNTVLDSSGSSVGAGPASYRTILN